jgi:hypothetical protein
MVWKGDIVTTQDQSLQYLHLFHVSLRFYLIGSNKMQVAFFDRQNNSKLNTKQRKSRHSLNYLFEIIVNFLSARLKVLLHF